MMGDIGSTWWARCMLIVLMHDEMLFGGDDDDGCGGRECGFVLTLLMMVLHMISCFLYYFW